jgi:imidazole glycerol-phosphate synthase subunit HisH
MSRLVTVVDYDCGNLFSVARTIEHFNGRVEMATTPEQVIVADRLILPGVGAFGTVMNALRQYDLVSAVREFAKAGRPFLGICVGMQVMMDYSEEFGSNDGLALIPGAVRAIPKTKSDGTPHPVPHIGWSELQEHDAGWEGTLFDGLGSQDAVYFVHSFAAAPDKQENILATCSYNGQPITAAIVRDNMTGCQFHPEKSGPVGLKIIHNFMDM